ncbi:M24 family metallopeptidase [Thalassorhabdus alkalitolerans]|uniref:M24 family metallopeptidase n=1 Tax=Thalassorhabdus alkalitolerans TaxID=2282697 RepID=A0ABW0YJD3_9BACI|nr:M24 family metallopeptidase [Bacillus sp. FJAT-44742]
MTAFPKQEYDERLIKVKEEMERAGVELLLISDPANMNYITGYDGWSFYVSQMVMIFIDEPEPYWFGRGQDVNGAKATTWLPESHLLSYGDEFVHAKTKHPMDEAGRWLKSKGKHAKRIGVELDAYYFSAKAMNHLEQALPDAAFADTTNLVNYVRMIKSDREITFMKRAAAIAEEAMNEGIRAIQEGTRTCDIAAAISSAQIRGANGIGGDYPAIVPLIPAGELTFAPHLTWTDEPLKKGEPIIIELAGCYRRYHAPLARTVVLGKPDAELQRLAYAVTEGIENTLDSIRPGLTCEEIEGVWRNTISKHGFNKDSRIGYSIGVNYPPDWGEHTASIRPGDHTILQPNMAFHLIPGIWLDNMGVEISESFIVTDKGCETLVDYPRSLIVQPGFSTAI